jgi:Fur family ferric uptake transcriptional regulator
VLAAVQNLDAFLSAQAVHELLRSQGETIGLSTVYRTLQALEEAGWIDAIRPDGGEVLYRGCGGGGHGHLLCRHCRRAVEVACSDLLAALHQAAAEHGYQDATWSIDGVGICPACIRRAVDDEAPTGSPGWRDV